MTLLEYNPFFNYVEDLSKFKGVPDVILIDDKKVQISDALALDDEEKNQIVLSDFNIGMLNTADVFCFFIVMSDLNDDERKIHSILKTFLNHYEERGGYPLDWIHYVLSIFTANYFNFSELSQTYIETFLTQSLVNYERNPYRRNRLTNPYFDDEEENSYELLKTFFLKQYDIDKLLLELKDVFPIEKGKDIRIIIEILIDYNILVIPDKKFRLFYNCLKEFFERNIGTYTSINDYKTIHESDKDKIKVKIDDILKRLS